MFLPWRLPIVAALAASLSCIGCATEADPEPPAASEQGIGVAIAGTYPLLAGAEGLLAGTGVTACFASVACGIVVVTGVVLVGTVYWLTVRPAEVGELPVRRIEFPAWLSANTYCPNVPSAEWFPILNARYDRCIAASGGSACGPRTVAEAGTLVKRLAKCIQSGGGSGCGTPAWVSTILRASDSVSPVPEWDRQNLNPGASSILEKLDTLYSSLLPALECREKNGGENKDLGQAWSSARNLLFTAKNNGGPLHKVVRDVVEAAKLAESKRADKCVPEEDAAARALRQTICAMYNIIRNIPEKNPTGSVATARATMEVFFAAAGFTCEPN